MAAKTNKTEAIELLRKIDPSKLDYEGWFLVGTALKGCGCSWQDWDNWSKLDAGRYHDGDCERRWPGMKGTGLGALIKVLYGDCSPSSALDWNETYTVVSELPKRWGSDSATDVFHMDGESKSDVIGQLGALFSPEEHVNYVVRFISKGKRMEPLGKGLSDRSCEELIRDLEASDDIGGALGDYDPAGGALVRINPMDGRGVADANVTAFRHVLVECDEGALKEQLDKIVELRLPCSCIVYSGNKSVHAAVRIGAKDADEFKRRVGFLYDYCDSHGLKVDVSTKNPSRMMRMAGAMRNGVRQSLIATNCGMPDWESWHAWATGTEMPGIVNLASVWGNLPELSPEMIDGILRVGHKLLLAGPSKAGKSFLLIELAIAVAEGSEWLGRKCRQGRVLYVNLEVDPASCLHRFEDVYHGLGIDAENTRNIDVFSLRGHAKPLDKLVPVLLAGCEGKEYSLVIIDPIYKVITGDENSATDMAYFVAQLDVIADRLGCCVAYAHHHSKGKQGSKYAMDRMSGSGVFARDPDAIIDMSPLVCSVADRRKGLCGKRQELVCSYAKRLGVTNVPDDFTDTDGLRLWARSMLGDNEANGLIEGLDELEKVSPLPEAFRIAYELREFASPRHTNLWFSYPVHQLDCNGALENARVDGGPSMGKETAKKDTDPCESIEFVYGLVGMGESVVAIKELAEFLEMSTKTVQRRLDQDGQFERKNGMTWMRAT